MTAGDGGSPDVGDVRAPFVGSDLFDGEFLQHRARSAAEGRRKRKG